MKIPLLPSGKGKNHLANIQLNVAKTYYPRIHYARNGITFYDALVQFLVLLFSNYFTDVILPCIFYKERRCKKNVSRYIYVCQKIESLSLFKYC